MDDMIRTRHALLIVGLVIVILAGLLIAVRVWAPSATENILLPAAVFSAFSGHTYPVVVVEAKGTSEAGAALIEKVQMGAGTKHDVREAYLHSSVPEVEVPPYPSSGVAVPQEVVVPPESVPMPSFATTTIDVSAEVVFSDTEENLEREEEE